MRLIRPLSPIIILMLSSLLIIRAPGQSDGRENEDRKDLGALTGLTSDTEPDPAITDPLVRILVSKGILSKIEGRSLSESGTHAEQRDRLARLLLDKGIITAGEFESLSPPSPKATVVARVEPERNGGLMERPRPAAPVTEAQPANTQPPVIAAVAPIRPLQIDPIKPDGLIPDLKLGSGGKIKFYGLLKTSIIHDSSSPMGNDFPLPGFLADTGPDGSPEFHLKTRSLRLGANFEWPDASPRTAITGRIEFDFEGNFTRANNRNISAVRSSQPSIRLAYGRIDRAMSENVSAFALFGQDWTPFGSSTLPNLLEITTLGLGYGTLYERLPQARFGANFKVPGNRSGLQFQPEFALALPAAGNLPTNVADQEGFGERQGADSAKPELQGRFVTQWQLDKARGVAPAQLIASWVWARRRAIVTAAGVPAAFKAAFPTGAEVESSRWGYSLEAQLPTRFVTLLAKYYRGADLRFYLANQIFSNFTDTSGLTGLETGNSIDGSSVVTFGLRNGVPEVAPQLPVRGQGGFVNLGFPLSRIFNADPSGRQAGWSAYLHYGFDHAFARDVRRIGASNRGRSDMAAATLYYRFNNWLTFGYEQSLYRTRAVNNVSTPEALLPLFRGIPSRETHDLRSEFATIFIF